MANKVQDLSFAMQNSFQISDVNAFSTSNIIVNSPNDLIVGEEDLSDAHRAMIWHMVLQLRQDVASLNSSIRQIADAGASTSQINILNCFLAAGGTPPNWSFSLSTEANGQPKINIDGFKANVAHSIVFGWTVFVGGVPSILDIIFVNPNAFDLYGNINEVKDNSNSLFDGQIGSFKAGQGISLIGKNSVRWNNGKGKEVTIFYSSVTTGINNGTQGVGQTPGWVSGSIEITLLSQNIMEFAEFIGYLAYVRTQVGGITAVASTGNWHSPLITPTNLDSGIGVESMRDTLSVGLASLSQVVIPSHKSGKVEAIVNPSHALNDLVVSVVEKGTSFAINKLVSTSYFNQAATWLASFIPQEINFLEILAGILLAG